MTPEEHITLVFNNPSVQAILRDPKKLEDGIGYVIDALIDATRNAIRDDHKRIRDVMNAMEEALLKQAGGNADVERAVMRMAAVARSTLE